MVGWGESIRVVIAGGSGSASAICFDYSLVPPLLMNNECIFLQITHTQRGRRPSLVTSCPMSYHRRLYRIIRINIFLDYYKCQWDRYIFGRIAVDRQINESYFTSFVYWHSQLTVARTENGICPSSYHHTHTYTHTPYICFQENISLIITVGSISFA